MSEALQVAVKDQETRLHESDHQSLKLWLRLLTCTSLIETRLRARLREQFDSTLPRFDFMAQLQRAPDGLTMGEISQRMMVSGGNVSGIASQLDAEGLISRSPLPDNRRTVLVKLTAKGKRSFNKMAEEHEDWIIEMLGGLPKADVDVLMSLLQKLKLGAQATPETGSDR